MSAFHRRRTFDEFLRSRKPYLATYFAGGGAGGVHGHVAAADHDHPLAHVHLEAQRLQIALVQAGVEIERLLAGQSTQHVSIDLSGVSDSDLDALEDKVERLVQPFVRH